MVVSGKSIAKIEGKINQKFLVSAIALHNDKSLTEEEKKLNWAVLINTLTKYALTKSNKLSEEELYDLSRKFVKTVTGSDNVNDYGLLDVAVHYGMVLQNEIIKTRCWGICGRKN